MSLINDALKRARQAPVPPVPDLQFRGVEPAFERSKKKSVLPLLVLGLGAVLGGLLLWNFSHPNIATSQASPVATPPAQASTAPAASLPEASTPAQTPAKQAVSTAPAPTDIAAGAHPNVVAQPNPAQAPATQPAVQARSEQSTATQATPAPLLPATNIVAAVETAPPPPPPLKLQGVTFDPRRPSAVISGKTVFLGDHVRELRVVAIKQDSVTLANGSQRTVLTLAE